MTFFAVVDIQAAGHDSSDQLAKGNTSQIVCMDSRLIVQCVAAYDLRLIVQCVAAYDSRLIEQCVAAYDSRHIDCASIELRASLPREIRRSSMGHIQWIFVMKNHSLDFGKEKRQPSFYTLIYTAMYQGKV